MTKTIFENCYLLSAKLKDEVKKVGEKWEPTGIKKIELMLLIDVIDKDLKTGTIKYVSNVKEPGFNLEQLNAKLNRFAKLDVTALTYEYTDRVDYKFTKITCDGVDLTTASVLTPADDTSIPF